MDAKIRPLSPNPDQVPLLRLEVTFFFMTRPAISPPPYHPMEFYLQLVRAPEIAPPGETDGDLYQGLVRLNQIRVDGFGLKCRYRLIE